jgi:hypothetical protein
MAQALETDRRQHLRDGILELLGDITYGVLRKHGVDGSAQSTAAQPTASATATT